MYVVDRAVAVVLYDSDVHAIVCIDTFVVVVDDTNCVGVGVDVGVVVCVVDVDAYVGVSSVVCVVVISMYY